MNVVVAVVVQNTLETAIHDKEHHMARDQAETQQALHKLMTVFLEADTDCNGSLTKEEFLGAIDLSSVTKLLHEVGIDVRQAENLFDILDYDESGVLEASEFMEGVMATRGNAKAKDVLAVQCDLWKAEQQIRRGLKGLDFHMATRLVAFDKKVKDIGEQGSVLRRAVLANRPAPFPPPSPAREFPVPPAIEPVSPPARDFPFSPVPPAMEHPCPLPIVHPSAVSESPAPPEEVEV